MDGCRYDFLTLPIEKPAIPAMRANPEARSAPFIPLRMDMVSGMAIQTIAVIDFQGMIILLSFVCLAGVIYFSI